MDKIDEIEKSISIILKRILPALRSKREILHDDFETLFKNLDELVVQLQGREMITRSLAYKLYHLQYEVNKEFSYIQDEKIKGQIQSKLHMSIAAVFNDNYFR